LEGKVLLLQSSTGVYFGLNPVGAFVWEQLQNGSTVDQLVDAVKEQYEAEPRTIEADVKQLLSSLHSEGLIKVDESTG
jgi:phage-related protein